MQVHLGLCAVVIFIGLSGSGRGHTSTAHPRPQAVHADSIPEGRWAVNDDGGNVCIATSSRSLPEGTPWWAACQRIGPVHVGHPLSRITSVLPDPHRVLTDTDSTYMAAYLLRPASESSRSYPYLVVGARRDRVTLLQLTGPPTSWEGASFSSIRLGDTTRVVTETLGPPSDTSVVEGMDGVRLWSYGGRPFSIEIRDGRVFSIRLWQPGMKGGMQAPDS